MGILDLTHYKDRENRWTQSGYDALRQRVAMIDPLNCVTRCHWCYCGALQELYDAEGNYTHWDYYNGGRLWRETDADGSKHIYSYDFAGRPFTFTNANGQVKTCSYYRNGQLAGTAYINSQQLTTNIGFTYDPTKRAKLVHNTAL